MRKVTRCVGLTLVLFSAACTENGTGDAVTSPITSMAKSPAPNKGPDARAAFHAKNHVDWVGEEHNKALADFFAGLGGGDPAKLCADLEDFAASRTTPGNDLGPTNQRRGAARIGLAFGKLCGAP